MSANRTQIGEFEELLLLAVASLGEQAYGVAIKKTVAETTGRDPSISAVHSTMTRLEDKGFLVSRLAEPTAVRGGRRKRLFSVTASGKAALIHAQDVRDRFRSRIPWLGGLDPNPTGA